MAKYRAFFETVASGYVTVDVPDNITDPGEIQDYVNDHADGNDIFICAQCGGWGRNTGIEVGEWEPEQNSDGSYRLAELVDNDD